MKLESTAAPAALPAWPGGDGSVLQLHFSWRRKHQTSPNTLTGPALDPGSPLTSRRAAGWGDRTVTLCWTCASGLSLPAATSVATETHSLLLWPAASCTSLSQLLCRRHQQTSPTTAVYHPYLQTPPDTAV